MIFWDGTPDHYKEILRSSDVNRRRIAWSAVEDFSPYIMLLPLSSSLYFFTVKLQMNRGFIKYHAVYVP